MIEIEAPEGFDGRALEAGEGWLIFLRQTGGPYWLCAGGVTERPRGTWIATNQEGGTLKLIALLGLPWEEIEADVAAAAGWQRECMRGIERSSKWKAKLRGSTPAEIAEWRAAMHTLEPGEDLREKITGIDPLAGRN